MDAKRSCRLLPPCTARATNRSSADYETTLTLVEGLQRAQVRPAIGRDRGGPGSDRRGWRGQEVGGGHSGLVAGDAVRGALDAPVHKLAVRSGVELVEVDDRLDLRMLRGDLSVGVGHPGALVTRALDAAELGEHYRLARGLEVWQRFREPEIEGQPTRAWKARAPVEAAHRDPVDVAVARVVRGERVRRRVGDALAVDAPHPRDVRGPFADEEVVDVPPRGNELLRRVPVREAAPRVPVAVHLVHQTDHDRPARRLHVAGEGADVGIVRAADDVRELERSLVR